MTPELGRGGWGGPGCVHRSPVQRKERLMLLGPGVTSSWPCCLEASSPALELSEGQLAPLRAALTPSHAAESSHALGELGGGSSVGSGSPASSAMGANILFSCQRMLCWKWWPVTSLPGDSLVGAFACGAAVGVAIRNPSAGLGGMRELESDSCSPRVPGRVGMSCVRTEPLGLPGFCCWWH